MKVFNDIAEAARALPRPVITIGNFDGVHLGHQAIVSRLIGEARRLRTASLALTFEPHPLRVLAPERCPPMIQTRRQKHELLATLGLDGLLVYPFTPEFARSEAELFVRQVLSGQLGIRGLVIGENFTFGQRRRGGISLLRVLAAEIGFELIALTEFGPGEQEISSTRIRRLLGRGLLPETERVLGRPYAIIGQVVEGWKLGAKLGFPTANVETENHLLLPDGVYIASLERLGRRWEGVASLGIRPTIPAGPGLERERALEVHLLQDPGNLYGEAVQVHFHVLLRPQQCFESLSGLQAQIARDVEAARVFYRELSAPRAPVSANE